MGRKLFCELSPLTYAISHQKEIVRRQLRDFGGKTAYAATKSPEELPVLIQKHKSLIRRALNNVDMNLQENKAKSLGIAAPKVSHVLIRPGEVFSFWKLVGKCSRREGYLDGVTISNGKPTHGVGGGLCQFTNLLHWMFLHTSLDIVEHHHHNGLDLFPDFNRQIPFGTGTSIVYNYLDYRVKNETDMTFQVIVYTTDEYLCGEIRAQHPMTEKVHIREEDAHFFEQGGQLYRHNKIYRRVVDKRTGNTLEDRLLLENTAKTMYGREFVPQEKIRPAPLISK